jgi:5-methylcytosine-specific restriction enzyme A
MRRLSGRHLNELWQVGARHALYREDGRWYHQLVDFPGALFDANGYVIFETDKDYLESPHLQIQQHIHVPGGISTIPGYAVVSESGCLQPFSQKITAAPMRRQHPARRGGEEAVYDSPSQVAINLPEGNEEKRRTLVHTCRIIRDTRVSNCVKRLYAYLCQICGDTIQFSHGQRYAEAHHLRPLGRGHNGPDVIENVICVCPKHHVLLDYGEITLEKNELWLVPEHILNEAYIAYHNTNLVKARG